MGSKWNLIGDLKRDLRSKTGKQTFTLYGSQIITLFLGVFIGIINTRTLGPKGYGILSLYLAIISFTVLFFRFGFFSASGLLIAEAKKREKERELTGASIIIALLIGITYSLFILILSFFIDDLLHTNIGWILRYTSFMLVALPFTMLVPQVGRGTNKIEKLSAFNMLPNLTYLLSALLLLKIIQIKAFHFILLYILATTIGIIVVFHLFQPLFRNVMKNLKIIWKKTKEYGFHLYLGQIADQSTYKLDKIFISYFSNATQVGFYSLAMAITSPMTGLPTAMSMSLFKRFVDMSRIPKKVIYYNFLWLATSVIGLALFGRFIVTVLFTERFLPTFPLILPLSLASFFQGMYKPYNMFLGAKGKGKWLRNISIAQAIFNINGNIIFIYYWGALGAAIASAIAALIAFIGYIIYYYKYLSYIR
ncbi:MAG: lipopolysaccharide biosynthesis protein [Candidatus Njordarchaeum guaymaensis]